REGETEDEHLQHIQEKARARGTRGLITHNNNDASGSNDQDQKRLNAPIDTAALQQIVAAILPTILQSLTYDGSGGASKLETFILKVDNYFRATNISDAVEVDIVVGKLVGDAAIFWLN
ncbi:MAG: hypothetical protein BJ554DRAFT_2957, partial [Olpidium bornovanus]